MASPLSPLSSAYSARWRATLAGWPSKAKVRGKRFKGFFEYKYTVKDSKGVEGFRLSGCFCWAWKAEVAFEPFELALKNHHQAFRLEPKGVML